MADTLSTISPRETRAQRQVDALLEREGIRRDAHIDYTCGIFDDDWRLIATGSCYKNTIRCLAVSGEHQGEGLLNRVVSHLTQVQFERGNSHVFLYTKPKSARFFGDLGFSEIARVEGRVVFMENRRGGFAAYLRALERAPQDGCAAVVMNANPFTLGHRRLVETAAARHPFVHLFLLSEEAGPIPFAVRRRLVQEGIAGLDNVLLHDSGPYIISSATFPSYFLKGEDDAIRAHAALDIAVFAQIAAALGITTRFVGDEPTSRVTALYNEVMARDLPAHGVDCIIIPRLAVNGRTVSASTVRQAIHDGAPDSVADMLPESTRRYFASAEAKPVVRAIRAMDDPKHY
ncbi:MAG: [citrate (pro-3S)-lyase] ligase [Oscillospiraceae bacterium]|nr:[citrate (pro-3S)-lyase] ligase [Oscillospiraceae bacterium]